MTIDDEKVSKINFNNAKARAIVDSLIQGIIAQQEGFDVMILLDAAYDYLDQNNDIFIEII